MSIEINGKIYRNLQEQVQKNMDDIEELQERVDDGYYTKEESDVKFQTKANMSDYYDKTESDVKFQTKIGMALYATQQQLNLNIAATEARTDLLLANKQDILVSGTNIKTVNGNSLVGSGNINIDTNYTAGYGIGIVNDVISIDQNTVATTNMLNGYIKNNDTDYSATFRGKAVWIKEEGAYTATSYGDGAIARSIPRQPGYEYDFPNKSGTFALLDDIPATVSGVNNGTNWTSITIGSDTYGIPTGGSGSIVAGTGINVSNGVVSVDNTVAMKTDIPAQTKLYAHKISFNITFAGSNNITGIASIISTSSTQITTSTALSAAVRERSVVPANGKYTGSSSANNGRVIELTYSEGSNPHLCAVVVYDYEDIIDVLSIASNTVTDAVTQI